MRILFLHGWRSVIGGVKPTYLKEAGHEVLNPALDDDDFDLAVRTAQSEYDQHKPDVVVGSSRGGAIAMNINSKDTPLVLLCPAWKNWGTANFVKPNTIILHSRQDDVIPFADSEELVTNSGLPPEMLIEVGDDHRLANSEPLKVMLEAVAKLTGDSSINVEFCYGTKMSLKGVSESCVLQTTLGLKAGKCYWNCHRILREIAGFQGATYVEGIAVKPRISIHAHGWIEKNFEVIDPTQPTAEFYYYPALRFQGTEGLDQAIRDIPRSIEYQGELPIYKRYGRNGEECDVFRMALETALREFGRLTPFNPLEEL